MDVNFDLMSLLSANMKEVYSVGKHSRINIPYTDIGMIKGGIFVHVQGVVIHASGLESWNNCDGSGEKIFFDLADETGVIRIFAWHSTAKYVSQFIKEGQTIGLMNLIVHQRKERYNNLNHPFELEFDEGISRIVQLKPDSIEPIEIKPNFVSFRKVRKFRPNEYFDVTGKIVCIESPLIDAISFERGTRYDRRFIHIADDNGDQLKIVSWNEYIPVSENNKTLSIIGGKWIDEWDNVNSSGAQIFLDGVRVK